MSISCSRRPDTALSHSARSLSSGGAERRPVGAPRNDSNKNFQGGSISLPPFRLPYRFVILLEHRALAKRGRRNPAWASIGHAWVLTFFRLLRCAGAIKHSASPHDAPDLIPCQNSP